ncbi:MAG TPA: serine-threonine protein kinase [Actinomycetota bacterium]
MGEIAGLPYWEIAFDERGRPNAADADALTAGLPAQGVTDLMMFAHGWNNDRGQATTLYRRFFEQVPGLLPGGAAPGLGFAGVIWPSKRWADESIPGGGGGGAAGLAEAGPAPGDKALVADLADVFTAPEQRAALDELGELLATRPDDPAALARFQALMAELSREQDARQAGEDEGETALLTDEPQAVFGRFAQAVPAPAGAAGEGGAAGLGSAFSRLWNGAKEALRQLTYFEMKKRAGVVGQQGLGPLVGRLAATVPDLRVHLIGHSFGARLVSFSLAGLPDPGAGSSPVKSLLLIQGAFSHFAFADALPDDRRRGGALKGMVRRVDGPLATTFSVHDLAVGKLYPLASLSSHDDAAGVADALFRWGGMGHDGAQAVDATVADLGPVGSGYPFRPGRFVNLDGNGVVTAGPPPSGAHSDIFHPELVWAGLAAAGLAGSP